MPSQDSAPAHFPANNFDNTGFSPVIAARAMMPEAIEAARGDASTAEDLSLWVHELKSEHLLNSVGDSLAKDGCTVVKDANGEVSELVFNDPKGHKLDLKIGADNKFKINGLDENQIHQASTDCLKEMNKDRIALDDSLSKEAKPLVTKMEDALLTGDSKAFIDAVKDLKGKPELGKEVADRLNADKTATSVNYYLSGDDGSGDLVIKGRFAGDSLVIIPTDGNPIALTGGGLVPHDAGNATSYVDHIGKDFNTFMAEMDHMDGGRIN